MKKRVFTLVELLIVIGIIIILSGVLLPVLVGAGKKADQTKAKAEITTLVNAIKHFESTYGVLPIPDGAGEVLTPAEYTQLILILQAENTADDAAATALTAANTNKNSRKVKFLDIVGNRRGVYVDPWDRFYNVLLDHDYNGEITTIPAGVSIAPSTPLRYSIVVWSTGPDGASAPTANDKSNRDNVYSFSTSWSKATGHTIER